MIFGVLTVWQLESIGDSHQGTSGGCQAIDHVWQGRRRPKVLQIAIQGIGEIDVAVTGIDGHIVERVELTTKEVV